MKICYSLSVLTEFNLAEFLNGTSDTGYFTRFWLFEKPAKALL